MLRNEAPLCLSRGAGNRPRESSGRRHRVEVAERIGYREMKLDTLPSMVGAQSLYRKLGFEVSEPHYDTPVAGTLFMRRTLHKS